MTTDTDNASATDRYMEFWNSAPPEARKLAPEVFTDDVDYRSPAALMQGAEALIDFRAQFIAHVGPASFAARREPEEHNDRIRLLWEIRLGDGTSFATGTDVLAITEDGRIGSVSAFLDRAPEGLLDHHDHG
ncbi:isomerase [Streptomonospora alba]|uniref:Isomerase n=1 Tax=Streptomonospora alba TaxID=183763 RepID=A0A0C2G0E6_9ACTN|nr:nuclear transport factor 2 family protein [Streptomonospora alba]KIH96793.1 isomerase [Streptomonospora alba]